MTQAWGPRFKLNALVVLVLGCRKLRHRVYPDIVVHTCLVMTGGHFTRGGPTAKFTIDHRWTRLT